MQNDIIFTIGDIMNQFYLTVTNDGSFKLLPYLPNKKYFTPNTKIFELPDHTTIEYIYKLIDQALADQSYNNNHKDTYYG